MNKLTRLFHKKFYEVFGFKWRNPFITASKLLFKGRFPERLLGVWDFGNGRATIGDAIVFHEILLVIAEEEKLETIDLCFVNPPPTKKNLYQITNPGAIENIISLTKINPRIGSVYIFNDDVQFSHFFNYFKDRYTVYPNPFFPFAAISNIYHITDYYDRHGCIPKLRSSETEIAWAERFIDLHCMGRVPITASLRCNERDRDRNAATEIWIEFFKQAADRYPEFKFVIIGTEEEIVPELLGRPNMVFAKYVTFTSLLQDIALVEASKGFVAHASGPSSFPWFSGIPSVNFGYDTHHIHFGHALAPGETYAFLENTHIIQWGPYSLSDILSYFEKYIVKPNRTDSRHPS